MSKIFYITRLVILLIIMSAVNLNAQVTKDNLDQNADQSQGNYAPNNLQYLGVGSLGMMQSAWKDPLQNMGEGQTKPGYTKYYWTPELVLPLRVREGMYTLINFPEWEIIEDFSIGDVTSFGAETQGPSNLMVYPNASQFVGVDTNMIVFGRSGNKYVFYLQSETVNTDRITNAIVDIEVVDDETDTSKSYASGSGGNVNRSSKGTGGGKSTYTSSLQKEDWIENIPVDPTQFRFDIEVYIPNPDDIIIAPERVWRDNIFTYIDLGEKALTSLQRPIVTLIVERAETPVGFRTAGPNNRLIIVEGMGDMVLRSGKRIICLKLRRADTDGLENSIYAKTNEWDLQRDNTTNNNSSNEEDQVENVYGSDVAKTQGQSSNNGYNNFFGDLNNSNNSKNSNSLNSSGSTANASNALLVDINSYPKSAPIVSYKNGSTPQLVIENNSEVTTAEMNSLSQSNPKITVDNNLNTAQQSDFSQNNSNVIIDNSTSEKDSNNFALSSSKAQGAGTSNDLYPEVSAETLAMLKEVKNVDRYAAMKNENISIELGVDSNVNVLEQLWQNISKRYSAVIGHYQPYYSVDTAADGQGQEVFHLRVGPIKNLAVGDDICSQLGRNGIFCSVVRVQ